MSTPVPRPAVLVVGIAPRSGTNYLHDLITLHPRAAGCPPVMEDYLLHYAAPLQVYARQVASRWRTFENTWRLPLPRDAESGLLAALGDGLLGYLGTLCQGEVLVTKTPSAENLDLAPLLFPHARLVLLVRDGRAVVESSVRSRLGPQHGNRYDVFTEQWTAGARAILHFCAAFPGRYHLVRYEDLVEDLAGTLPALLAFCDLDAAAYDFAAARALPVRGSSTFGQAPPPPPEPRARAGAHLDWQPKPRTADFEPLRRWADWPAARHAAFNAVAGECMTRLGYALQEATAEDAGR
ncbi:MAG: sulfotransferase [Gammaproteobacteria bacterium]